MSVRAAALAAVVVVGCATGCTRAPDDATPTPQPRTSTSIPISMASGVPTPGLGSFPFPRSIASPTPRPMRPIPISPLIVDGAAGRVYASGPVSGTAQLSAYDAHDGRLVDRVAIATDERLLDIDRRQGRLALWSAPGVRWLDGRTLAEVGQVSLPAWDPIAVSRAKGYMVSPMDLPLVDPRTGQIVLLQDQRIVTIDGETGALVSVQRVPVPDTAGPIVDGALSEDGRVLYVAVADHSVASLGAPNGAVLLALDRWRGGVIERRALDAWVDRTLSWGNSWLVVGAAHRGMGDWNSLWVDGHERRRLVGADSGVRWTAFDTRRQRLIGFLGRAVVLGDPTHIDMTDYFPLGFEPPFQEWDEPPLTAYDVTTDAFYGRGSTVEHVLVLAAARIAPEAAATDGAPIPHPTVRVLTALLPPSGAGEEPLAFTGMFRATPGIGTPTPKYEDAEYWPAIRRPSDPEWRLQRPDGIDAWPGTIVAAPAPRGGAGEGPWLFGIGSRLFGIGSRAGVFRSTDFGRSWHPAAAGIDALIVDALDVSPNFARDTTLFATSYSTGPADRHADDPTDAAWRSRDGGDTWKPVGRLRALAISPDFARDRTAMAFGYFTRTFHISTDGGDTWADRGRLPDDPEENGYAGELGPYPWESWILPARTGRGRIVVTLTTSDDQGRGLALFTSTDDGASWRRAWTYPGDAPPEDDFVDNPQLLGETDGTLVLRTSLRRGPLLSGDGGRTWSDAWLPDEPDAVPLAVRPNGVVLGAGHRSGASREGVWVRPVEDFVARATAER